MKTTIETSEGLTMVSASDPENPVKIPATLSRSEIEARTILHYLSLAGYTLEGIGRECHASKQSVSAALRNPNGFHRICRHIAGVLNTSPATLWSNWQE